MSGAGTSDVSPRAAIGLGHFREGKVCSFEYIFHSATGARLWVGLSWPGGGRGSKCRDLDEPEPDQMILGEIEIVSASGRRARNNFCTRILI